jgi:hypothetical protein
LKLLNNILNKSNQKSTTPTAELGRISGWLDQLKGTDNLVFLKEVSGNFATEKEEIVFSL